jgi:hypothetical protein
MLAVKGRYGPVGQSHRIVVADNLLLSPSVPIPIEAFFENGMELVGYRARQERDGVRLVLIWRVVKPLAHEPRLFIHLLNGSGEVVAQQDGPLSYGLSVLDWPIGSAMPDPHNLSLDGVSVKDDLSLEIGLTALFSGERQNLQFRDGREDDRVLVEPIEWNVP